MLKGSVGVDQIQVALAHIPRIPPLEVTKFDDAVTLVPPLHEVRLTCRSSVRRGFTCSLLTHTHTIACLQIFSQYTPQVAAAGKRNDGGSVVFDSQLMEVDTFISQGSRELLACLLACGAPTLYSSAWVCVVCAQPPAAAEAPACQRATFTTSCATFESHPSCCPKMKPSWSVQSCSWLARLRSPHLVWFLPTPPPPPPPGHAHDNTQLPSHSYPKA